MQKSQKEGGQQEKGRAKPKPRVKIDFQDRKGDIKDEVAIAILEETGANISQELTEAFKEASEQDQARTRETTQDGGAREDRE